MERNEGKTDVFNDILVPSIAFVQDRIYMISIGVELCEFFLVLQSHSCNVRVKSEI